MIIDDSVRIPAPPAPVTPRAARRVQNEFDIAHPRVPTPAGEEVSSGVESKRAQGTRRVRGRNEPKRDPARTIATGRDR